MARILIATAPGDRESAVVASALKDLGHESFRWLVSEFGSTHELACLALEDAPFSTSIVDDAGETADLSQFDVFWNRRMRPPTANLPDGEPYREQTLRERQSLLEGVYFHLEHQMRCINPYSAIQKTKSKLLQLMTAKDVGLAVADTLMSNSRPAIQAFTDGSRDVVFKSFNAMFWRENGKLFKFYTTKLTPEDLAGGPDMRPSPYIFQRNIPKLCELRSVFMGSEVTTVKISALDDTPLQDWRSKSERQLRYEPYDLPENIKAKGLALMNRLGIQFGCFDFIVDPDGTYYFLEVNQAGQSLFFEETCPELRVLDKYCQFLTHAGDPFDFRFDPKVERLRTRDRDAATFRMTDAENETHATSVYS